MTLQSEHERASAPSSDRPWLASYPPGVGAALAPAGVASLADIWRNSRARWGERKALDYAGRAMSYDELGRNAEAVAAWLQAQGVAKGDRVAIMMPNIMAYPVVILGILLTGATVVNVNPLYTAREIEHQLNDSGARVLFVFDPIHATLEAIAPRLPVELYVRVRANDLTMADPAGDRDRNATAGQTNVSAFRDILILGSLAPWRNVDIGPDDIAFLQYTGGTTGVAKGAMLLHRNIIANISQVNAWFNGHVRREEQQVMVTALPLYHIFALNICFFYMMSSGGACLLIPNARDIGAMIGAMRRSPFTMIAGVNTLYAALADHPDLAKVDFSHAVCSIAGGMATQAAVAERWRKITGLPIIEGYGLTETSAVVTCNRLDITAATGSVGYPLPSTEIAIRAPDGGAMPPGTAGELCVRGPQVMAGYWDRPLETDLVTTRDRFFRTGDVAVILPDGQVKLVDRLKEMILVSGFNVYPSEVEDVIMRHDKVAAVAVVGALDDHSGEAVIAFVVRRDDSLTEDALIAFCRENLTRYKVPKRIAFREDLPKSAVGKILRRALQAEVNGA